MHGKGSARYTYEVLHARTLVLVRYTSPNTQLREILSKLTMSTDQTDATVEGGHCVVTVFQSLRVTRPSDFCRILFACLICFVFIFCYLRYAPPALGLFVTMRYDGQNSFNFSIERGTNLLVRVA